LNADKLSHYNKLQKTAIHCLTLQYFATLCNTPHRTATSRGRLPDTHPLDAEPYQIDFQTATHRNRLNNTSTHCNILHHICASGTTFERRAESDRFRHRQCNALQRTATHCNTLQKTCTNMLQRVAPCHSIAFARSAESDGFPHCNTLPHTATHCITLQHAATRCNTLHYRCTSCIAFAQRAESNTPSHCNTLQHAATHCNTVQHSATHCNTLYHTCTSRTAFARKSE